MKGVQVAGIVNYAKKMKGFQLGLINIADTLEGASFGLVNLSKNGYHKLATYSNEITNLNLALVTGSAKLYTQLGLDTTFLIPLKFLASAWQSVMIL